MKIILHIGMPKTGTSSIQRFCRDNRAGLAAQGFWYPHTPADASGNHVKLAAYAQNDDRPTPLRKDLGLTSPQALKHFRREFLQKMAAEVRGHEQKTLIMSNEHCSLLRHEKEVKRLASLLRAFSDDVKILVYVRRQVDLYVALHTTRVVRGESSFDLNITPDVKDRWDFNYLKQLDRWAKYFGPENIIVRPFERGQLKDDDAVKDYLDVLGVESEDLTFVERQNKRASKDCVQFLEIMYKYLPRYRGGTQNPDHRMIGDTIKAITDGAPYRAPHLLAMESLFDDINAEVARKYLGRSDGKLFLRPPKSGGNELEPLSTDKAVEICAKLWVEQNRIIDDLVHEVAMYQQLFQRLKDNMEGHGNENAIKMTD